MYQSLKLLSSNCDYSCKLWRKGPTRFNNVQCTSVLSSLIIIIFIIRQPGCTLGWGVGVEQTTRLNVLSARRCCYSAVGESGRFPKLFRLWLKQLRTVTRQKACNASAIQVSSFTDSRVTRSTQSSLIMTLEKAWHNSIDFPSQQHGIFG